MTRRSKLSPSARYVDPTLFTKKETFAGVFHTDGVASPAFSIEINYSLINEHRPFGIVPGTRRDYEALEAYTFKVRGPIRKLESVSKAEGRERTICEEVIIRSMGYRQFPEDEQPTIQDEIAQLEIFSFTISHDIVSDHDHRPFRVIRFFLNGPTWLWYARPPRVLSYDGNARTIKPLRGRVILGPREFKVAIHAHYLYQNPGWRYGASEREQQEDRSAPHRQFQVEAELHVIEIRERKLARDWAAFSAAALDYVDKLNLMMSLVSKASITWFGYAYSDNEQIIEHFRDTAPEPDPGLWWEDIAINSQDILPFLAHAVRAYERRKGAGIDLRMPILLYVGAQKMPYVEEKFIGLFQALERIVAQMPERVRGASLLRRDQLRLLRREVQSFLGRTDIRPNVADIVVRKLSNVGQPDLRSQLERALSHLRITLEDIGGVDALTKIFRVRNAILHQTTELEIETVVTATAPLETIVERLLIALLLWKKAINTPTYLNRIRLQ